MSTAKMRKILNPILVLSGFICAFTGLFLLFGIKSRLIMKFHEIISIVMLLTLVVHLLLNKTALINSCGGKKIFVGILALALLTVGILPFLHNNKTVPGYEQHNNGYLEGGRKHRNW